MSEALVRYLDVENEDDLTRIVFGILEMLGPPVLQDVLELPEGSLTDAATVSFHSRIDPRAERVPDVIVEDTSTTVMIEAKRRADFDPDQIRDEHEDLRRYGTGETHLVLVSGHESRPALLDDIEFEDVHWLGWRDVALRICRYDRADLTETQERLVELLRTKLEAEGYVPFAGVPDRLLDELPKIWSLSKRYLRHIATFYRDVEGRLGDRGLQAKNMWRDGVSQDFNRFPGDWQFVPSHLWIAYGEPDFRINSKHQHYLFVAFCVEGRTNPIVRVGYSTSPKRNDGNRETFTDRTDEIVEFVTETDGKLLHADWNFHAVERFTEENEMTSLLLNTDALRNFERIQLAVEYDADRLTDPTLVERVADDLVSFHEFTHPTLYP